MKVLVIGGTGYLGNQIAAKIQSKGHKLFALVRKGSDTTLLTRMGATLIPGNLSDKDSLEKALVGMDAVISTAIGYNNRKPEDTIASVDDLGNRNLGDTIKKLKIKKFIFLGVLKSDIANEVPHFKQKYLTEQYFKKIAIPYISLRPGGFLDQVLGWSTEAIKTGQLPVMIDPDVKLTLIHSDDIAEAAVQALSINAENPLIVDLGMNEPATFNEVAKEIALLMGKAIEVKKYPVPEGEMAHTLNFIGSGKYIADTTLQHKYFGELPTLKVSLATWLKSAGIN